MSSTANLSQSPEAGTSSRAVVHRIPGSTYRLQLRPDFGFAAVKDLLSYLWDLGISDIYLSPLFRARQESAHGYDVVNHGEIDPAFGDLAEFGKLARTTREKSMGIVLDVVPNHMGINDPGNAWWNDVLENGEGARYANYFDIDWQPVASHLQHKVLLPFLGSPFGETLEAKQLRVIYAGQRLQLEYFDRRFPLSPPTWSSVLDLADALWQEGADPEGRDELRSIGLQLKHLPRAAQNDPDVIRQKYREQAIARSRLHVLLEGSAIARAAFDEAITEINGVEGDPRSFDRLEELLNQQWYRLAYWRVAADEINYRRFFDINDLAAIRVEDPEVYKAVHRLVARFLCEDWITGLRIDHPDGLFDPVAYFAHLQSTFREHSDSAADMIYVVAEKILAEDEPLPPSWQVHGTTGYELLNLITRLLVCDDGLTELRDHYAELSGRPEAPADILYESKRVVLGESMSSELEMLASQLYNIAQEDRIARDFTLPSLRRALGEVIACMTVYRTYVRPEGWDVSDDDYRRVTTAVRMAKRRNPTLPFAALDFVSAVLLLQHPPGLTDEQARRRRDFSLKMQQVTGPVMAKGLEDTAFYRYYPLASLNEVGGELTAHAVPIGEFHRLMRHRLNSWPHSLSSTATHDTKRGEDVRARLDVLSEIAPEWRTEVARWQKLAQPMLQTVHDWLWPDANALYLLFQTLVGTWPLEDNAGSGEYCRRIQQYMLKAIREAKLYTSWSNPATDYEEAVTTFVKQLLSEDAGAILRNEISQLVERIATAGYVNGLSQILLKMTLPGVPDFYQGCEFWDFRLVDPDNRGAVDFEARRAVLAELQRRYRQSPAETVAWLSEQWPGPEVKMFTTWRTLALRSSWPELFAYGEYVPLETVGTCADHLIAFERRLENDSAVVLMPRLVQGLVNAPETAGGWTAANIDWGDTGVYLPEDRLGVWRNQFSQEVVEWQEGGPPLISAAAAFGSLPVALLVSGQLQE